MIGAEMRRNFFGMRSFVVTVFFESDRKSFDGATALSLHQGHDSAGIHASGKERTEWDVSHHAQADRSQEFLLELCDRLFVVSRERIRQTLARYIVSAPEFLFRECPVRRIQRQDAAW